MNVSFKNYLGIIFSSLFATYAIYEKFMLPELQIPMIISIIFCAVFIFHLKSKNITTNTTINSKIAYSLFAFFIVIGDSFKQYGSFDGIWGNPFINSDIAEKLFEDFASIFGFLNGPVGNALMLLSNLCKGIGYYFIIKLSFEIFNCLFLKFIADTRNFSAKNRFLNKFLKDVSFSKIFFFLILAWLPYWLIKFPGSISNDAMTQINQLLESRITTHHPFFTTLIYGSFAKLGLWLGNINIGIFIYILLQYTFMAAAFSYCIFSLYKCNGHGFFCFVLTLFFAFSPTFPCSATSFVKDALYSTFFVLFITQLILLIHNIQQKQSLKRTIITLCVISIFLTLTRNNGIYTIAPTLITLLIFFLIKINSFKKDSAYILIFLLLPLVFYFGFNYVQYNMLNLQKGSEREVLSIPFQQTARCTKEYPDEISAEDAEIIDKVLDYENLSVLYDPIISDPVKSTYKGDASALNDYFKVWFNQLKKHPVCYIEATVNTCYFAIYPDEPNIRAYSVFSKTNNPIRKALQILLLACVMGLSSVPVLTCLINPVFYVWIFIYLTLYFIAKKKYLYLLLSLPMFIQFLTIIAGPAVFNHPRYINPIYWSIPFVIAFLITNYIPRSNYKD